jgi:hypothetical protein
MMYAFLSRSFLVSSSTSKINLTQYLLVFFFFCPRHKCLIKSTPSESQKMLWIIFTCELEIVNLYLSTTCFVGLTFTVTK